MRSIHIGEKFPCNLCDYEATQKSNLKTHITRVHGMQNNVCKFCKTELDNRIDLENHVISVHEKDFQVCTYENCLYRAKTKVDNNLIFLSWTYVKILMLKLGIYIVWLFLLFFLNAQLKMPLKKFNNPHSNDLRKLPHRMKTASETIKCPFVCKKNLFRGKAVHLNI